MRRARLRQRLLLAVSLVPCWVRSVALYSKFREPCPRLAAEWNAFLASQGLVPSASGDGHGVTLGNSAKRHHLAVGLFCRQRRKGCSWAQYHALVDHSRQPYAHLFDSERINIGALPSESTSCRRVHAPTEEQLLELVVRSEPALLTGLLDWPALRRWDEAYLTAKLGHLPVTLSVSEGKFDHPEDPSLWRVATAAAAGGILDGMVEEVPTLRDEVEIGEIAISRWLMPKKQLLWMSGGRTLGSTHYDPYENLMAVVAGNKTFHLAHPDQGQLVGGFTRMREGQLHMAPGATALQRSPEQLTTQATELHHYAAASLSTPASEQPHLPDFARARVFACTAQPGDVLYIPAYWWHEVESHADPARGLSIGVNWFYESFYQRIFPNMSWDRSPHYVLLDQHSLRRPFPPSESASNDAPLSRRPDSERADSAGGQADAAASANAAPGARGAAAGSRFSRRLRERAARPLVEETDPREL